MSTESTLNLSALVSAPMQLTTTEVPLHTEIARLREDNDDLRASALYWKRLYEGAVRDSPQLRSALPASSADSQPLH